jgi:hypothetical protein
MRRPLATAMFLDIWAGAVPAVVLPFKTKRLGQTVTRYRWQRQDGMHCCGAVYTSPEAAVAAKSRDARFSDVRPS